MIDADGGVSLRPIGVFRSDAREKNEARRQGSLDRSGSIGVVELVAGLAPALRDLSGFERIWLIYGFHLSSGSRNLLVIPPRGPRVKRGVFATRAPYRPNPLGLSCVRLVDIVGLALHVTEHDLLDGTPIYDVKPYLASADAFPAAGAGWTEGLDEIAFSVTFSELAQRQIEWLRLEGVTRLREFLCGQLMHEPTDRRRKRVVPVGGDGLHVIAYRTWRARFRVDPAARRAEVEGISSVYGEEELRGPIDRYDDTSVHLGFIAAFGPTILG